MAASLRVYFKNGYTLLNNVKLRWNPTQANQGKIHLGQQIRQMSEKRTLAILPSRYEWTLFKDHLFYYLMPGKATFMEKKLFYLGLHLIPMGAIITYVNLTKGRCELTDIPEGYEPKYWEYYKHPISQFLARYFFKSPEGEYERYLHSIYVENEKRKLKHVEEKFRTLQHNRGDYKGWYYVPVSPDNTYKGYDTVTRKEKPMRNI